MKNEKKLLILAMAIAALCAINVILNLLGAR